MIAFKFLRDGAVGRFSGHAWPLPAVDVPAEWVVVDGPLELCVNGIHACTPRALSGWLDAQLWVVELAGELRRVDGMLLARRARLVRRVEEWPHDAAAEYAGACAERAAAISRDAPRGSPLAEYAADAARFARRGTVAGTALAAYAAALAAEAAEPNGFVAERHRQGEWLAMRLGLRAASYEL